MQDEDLLSMFIFLGGQIDGQQNAPLQPIHQATAPQYNTTNGDIPKTQHCVRSDSNHGQDPPIAGIEMYVFLGGKLLLDEPKTNGDEALKPKDPVRVSNTVSVEGQPNPQQNAGNEAEEDRRESWDSDSDSDWDDFGDFQAGDGPSDPSPTPPSTKAGTPVEAEAEDEDENENDEDFANFDHFDHAEERRSALALFRVDESALRLAFESPDPDTSLPISERLPDLAWNEVLDPSRFGPSRCQACGALLPIGGSACVVCGKRSVFASSPVTGGGGPSVSQEDSRGLEELVAEVTGFESCTTARRDLTTGLDEVDYLEDFTLSMPPPVVEEQKKKRGSGSVDKHVVAGKSGHVKVGMGEEIGEERDRGGSGRGNGEDVTQMFGLQEKVGGISVRAATPTGSVVYLNSNSVADTNDTDTEELETEEESEEEDEEDSVAIGVGGEVGGIADDVEGAMDTIEGGVFGLGRSEHGGNEDDDEGDEFTEFSAAAVLAPSLTSDSSSAVGEKVVKNTQQDISLLDFPHSSLNGKRSGSNSNSVKQEGDLLAMTLEGLGLGEEPESKGANESNGGAKECTVFERAMHIKKAKSKLAELFDGEKPPDLGFMQAKTVCVPKQPLKPTQEKEANENTDDPFLDLLS